MKKTQDEEEENGRTRGNVENPLENPVSCRLSLVIGWNNEVDRERKRISLCRRCRRCVVVDVESCNVDSNKRHQGGLVDWSRAYSASEEDACSIWTRVRGCQ